MSRVQEPRTTVKRERWRPRRHLTMACLGNGGRGPRRPAPELFHTRCVTYQADIASLGYTLLELLTGRNLFSSCQTFRELERAKRELPDRLEETLTPDLRRDSHLVELCRRMIAVDPQNRFADAEAANFDTIGAASFLRHLVKNDLWAEYDREMGDWLELVLDDPVSV